MVTLKKDDDSTVNVCNSNYLLKPYLKPSLVSNDSERSFLILAELKVALNVILHTGISFIRIP